MLIILTVSMLVVAAQSFGGQPGVYVHGYGYPGSSPGGVYVHGYGYPGGVYVYGYGYPVFYPNYYSYYGQYPNYLPYYEMV